MGHVLSLAYNLRAELPDAAPTAGQTNPYNLFSYDAFGNMSRRDRKDSTGARKILDFGWDADGRLRQALDESTSGSLLSATYTADGERVSKTDQPTGGHTYSYGLYDTNQDTKYTPGYGQHQGTTGNYRYYHHDWMGSTRYLSTLGGALPAGLRYDAYGNLSASAGTDPAHPTDYEWGGAWGYMREADASLGLDLLSQRYYDPAIGRFVSRDPIRWMGGVNLYGYCDGDPINGVDPLGLTPWYDHGIPLPMGVAAGVREGLSAVDPVGLTDLGEYLLGREFFTHRAITKNQALQHLKNRWSDPLRMSGGIVVGCPSGGIRSGELLQDRLEHIVERHWSTAEARGAGKFSSEVTLRRLRNLISETLEHGTIGPNSRGRAGNTFERDFGGVIGRDINGRPATSLRVIRAPDGRIITAFPF